MLLKIIFYNFFIQIIEEILKKKMESLNYIYRYSEKG